MTQWAVFSAKTLGIKKSFPLGMGRNSEKISRGAKIPSKTPCKTKTILI